MPGENQHSGDGLKLGNLLRGFQSAHVGHGDVHDHDIGMPLSGESYGYPAVFGFAANLPIGTRLQDRAYSLTHHFMIIRD
jgi:hypothetical protein